MHATTAPVPPAPIRDDPHRRPHERTRRRLALGAGAAVTVVAGLSVHAWATGAVADASGDALYPVLIYIIAAMIAPGISSVRIGSLALLFCVAVELFQLTGVPTGIADHFPPAALVLGSTFSALDLLCYAAGTAVITAVDATARRGRRS